MIFKNSNTENFEIDKYTFFIEKHMETHFRIIWNIFWVEIPKKNEAKIRIFNNENQYFHKKYEVFFQFFRDILKVVYFFIEKTPDLESSDHCGFNEVLFVEKSLFVKMLWLFEKQLRQKSALFSYKSIFSRTFKTDRYISSVNGGTYGVWG